MIPYKLLVPFYWDHKEPAPPGAKQILSPFPKTLFNIASVNEA